MPGLVPGKKKKNGYGKFSVQDRLAVLFEERLGLFQVQFGVDLGRRGLRVSTDCPGRVEVSQFPEPGQRRVANLVRSPGGQAMLTIGQSDGFTKAVDCHGSVAAQVGPHGIITLEAN